jgi:hypothetical protein
MMSRSITRVTRRNVRSFVPQAVAVDDRVAEIEILDDSLKLSALMAGCALFSFGAAALPCQLGRHRSEIARLDYRKDLATAYA